MKRMALAVVVALLCSLACWSAETLQSGTILSEKSVDCGTKNKGKKSSTPVLCQQYVVHTDTTEYQIRQQKASSEAIIPANTPIQFSINKDKMKFKVNGKTYQFLIVGTSAIPAEGAKPQ
jgi:carbonic anhydrase